MNTKILIVCLIAVVALAGCISPAPEDTETEKNETEEEEDATAVIQSLSLDRNRIFERGSTNLILTVQNGRTRLLEHVTATVGNRGSLMFDRRAPEQSSSRQHTCRYDEIAARTGTDPVTRRCVWSINAPAEIVGSARDEVTFPLTAFVSYSSTVAPVQDSLSAVFERRQDIAPGDSVPRSVRAANNDVAVTVTHESPVAAEDREVPITVAVQNVGTGTIVSGSQDRRSVILMFEGTLADAEWNMQETTCTDGVRKRKEISFRDNRQRAEVSCTIVLSEGSLAGKTFSLRPRLWYRYRVSQSAPLQVVKR